MDYYNEIKERIIKSEIYDRVKDYSKERNRVYSYYEIGKLLYNAGKEYGKNIIKQYANKLTIEVGKKYNERTLYNMRKFYEIFSNEKLNPMGSKLSWSHYRELLVVRDIDKIKYYINICEKNYLTKRELQERIKNHEYERLSEESRNKLVVLNKLEVNDLLPNPIFIKSNSLTENESEYVLKQLILNDLDDFLKQLGIGFTYVGNEYRIKLGDRYNYIDLLLFNYKYNCFVVIELKITELKAEHIGQIKKYINYIDKNVKDINQDNTIGIIIVRKDNKFVMEYCSDPRIFRITYMLICN